MKSNNIFYLLIVFFVIMIFIPPVLRVVLPKEELSAAPDVIKNLSCSITKQIEEENVVLVINNNYLNNKIYNIIFTYNLIQNVDLLDEDILLSEIVSLRNIPNANYIAETNTLSFNFNSYDFSNEVRLQKYSRAFDVQKAYYEQLGFVCSIK